MKICISSGHGMFVRGAAGIIDEVDEARVVTESLAGVLYASGHNVRTFHDDVSTSQDQNLKTITGWHNSCGPHDLDISVHFNAYEQTSKAMGCEVLYSTQKTLADKLSAAIAEVGLINRGGKQRDDLYVLSNTDAPCVLLEVCFVDSEADCQIYDEKFEDIISNIASVFSGDTIEPEPPVEEALFHVKGRCSHFGGPDDMGVSPDEGLAFIYSVDDAPMLFLPFQPEGTTGLARRLNPYIHYVACRWDYDVTPKPSLLEDVALVRATATGLAMKAFCADWGPHEEKTGRAADLSPGLMEDLGITTDSEVEVIFPFREK